MDLSVQRDSIMAGHTVLRNIDRLVISLIEELRSPVQALRGYRPVHCSFCISGYTVCFLRSSVRSHTERPAVIDILSVYIDRFGDKSHILVRDPWQIFLISLKPFFRIMSQQNRIRPPCHIPCPVRIVILHGEIFLARRLYIFRPVRRRIDDAACRRITDGQRLLCILS